MTIHLSAVPGDESPATGNGMFTYRPPRHVGRWVAGGLLVLLIGYLCVAFFSTPLIHFSVIPEYLFTDRVLDGLRVTFIILIASLLIGLFVGTTLAFMRMSANPVAKMVGGLYVWLFLATPGIVQLLFWYNLAIVFPNLGVGIPHVTTFWEVDTNSVISPLTASMLALGLHEAAYLCEIIRSGMISVDRGQIEAAQSLGIRASKVRWQIVLPQALRVMVPPGATRVVALMKDTALVMVISGGELMTTAQEIYGRNYLVLELLMVVTIWYLVIVSVLMLLQRFAEQWASRYVSGQQRSRAALTEG